MTDDLKPCPFCGGEAELPDGPYGSPVHVYEAKCTACYALGAQRDTKAEAREAWNRRPVEDALGARAEAAEARAAQTEADARLMAGLAFAGFVERTSFSPEIVEASLLDALEDASDHTATASDADLVAALRRILATAGAT